ncbi:unnamed protein product [Adineta ricciae]|uniref:Uncharacterized protein n=1 Tax=Adineta ricciae TaxID=249248 RepID=A0A815TJ38_ADIRI|nr:unnamed protein product [Adineta ricciae]
MTPEIPLVGIGARQMELQIPLVGIGARQMVVQIPLVGIDDRQMVVQIPLVGTGARQMVVQIPLVVIPKDLDSSSSSSDNLTMSDLSGLDVHDRTLTELQVKENIDSTFPAEYTIPQLPQSLLQDIEAGALHKFGPHHANRQVLIDTITYDLLKKYNLFYPSHKQFDAIGTAIVNLLKLPFTKDNLGIWKEAVQIKLKRKRGEHKDNVEVQYHLMKYSKTGSGRPVNTMTGEVAVRDRQKQILTMNYDDDLFNSMKIKSQELRDNNRIDRDAQVRLWKETLHVRRKLIRDLPTSSILEEYPGYKDSFLIFEEVRMTMEVDLRSVIRYQVPILLEKLMSVPAFITDPPPIQLIRTLCRQFGETVHHIYSDLTPSTPYPTLVLMNDVMHIFVDFIPIVSSTSPDDGLALLLAMYAVFELNFNKNSRTIRLLYATVFGDKRFLSNSIRNLIKEKQIDICFEQNRKISNLTSSVAANSAATATATTTSTPTSPPHANSQVVSQDQCASSSTNVIIGDSAVDKDESSDTNVNSQTFGTEVNQALSSSNVLVNRKRTRKALTQIPKGKENCLSFDNDNDNDNHDEHDHDEVIDSVCSQLSLGVRQTRKQKRRC